MKALLSVNYLIRYVYPGDYGSYVQYDKDYSWDYCVPCAEWHVTGNPMLQWQDSVIAAPKRDDNNCTDFLSKIVNQGMYAPVNIDLLRHKVVADGHHRVFAAWDLGWKYIPVRFSNEEGYIDYPPPISSRFLQAWDGSPYTESSYSKLLA